MEKSFWKNALSIVLRGQVLICVTDKLRLFSSWVSWWTIRNHYSLLSVGSWCREVAHDAVSSLWLEVWVMWHETFSDNYKRRKTGVLCEWNSRPLTFTALHKSNTPGHAFPPVWFMHCAQFLRSGKKGNDLIHSAISSCQTHVTKSGWSLLYRIKQNVCLLAFIWGRTQCH